MHPNPDFRKIEERDALDFASARGFGSLTINGDDGPMMSHVPFLLDKSGGHLDLHLLRSGDIARAISAAPQKALIAVTGPDGYISPDWYETRDQVPTWNYIAVHLRGTIERLPQAELENLLDRQSAHFEALLAPKRPWTSAKMGDGVMARMMRALIACRLTLSDVQSTWKLNQNKPEDVRLRAADQVTAGGIGSDLDGLARHMRQAQ